MICKSEASLKNSAPDESRIYFQERIRLKRGFHSNEAPPIPLARDALHSLLYVGTQRLTTGDRIAKIIETNPVLCSAMTSFLTLWCKGTSNKE